MLLSAQADALAFPVVQPDHSGVIGFGMNKLQLERVLELSKQRNTLAQDNWIDVEPALINRPGCFTCHQFQALQLTESQER